MDTQHMISDVAIGPVAYDTNFELKKSQLLIKFPFVCLNNLKFIEYRKIFVCNIHCAKFGLCCPGRPHQYHELSYATDHNKF